MPCHAMPFLLACCRFLNNKKLKKKQKRVTAMEQRHDKVRDCFHSGLDIAK
jgi:hypothetical protein